MNELLKSICNGNLETVKYLFENGADVHADNDYALKWASEGGHLEVVKYLVEHGADIHAGNDLSLRGSSYYGHFKIVKYLVENGADIHAGDDYALRWASEDGHLDIVKYLKTIYIKRYKEKFLCFNCLVLPCCTELCSDELIKGDKYE